MRQKTENEDSINEPYKLPDGWRWVRLGEVCEFEYGSGLPERDRVGGSIPVFGSNGIVGYHDVAITLSPTIIIGRKGSIGQVNFSETSCWPIDTTYFIDSSKTQCDLIWLYWLLKWLRLDLLNKATGVPGLNREDAYNQLIPLPPLEIQRRIAAKIQEFLQEVERAQTACKKQFEAVKLLPSAYLREVFESKEAKKWERKRLGEVCEFGSGKFIQKEKVKNKGAYPVYGANGIIGFTEEKLFDKEMIVIGRVGSCGVVNKTLGPAWITDNTIILQHVNQTTFDFLYWVLKSLKLEETKAASVQPLITQKDLKSILIPLPPIDLQRRIAADLTEKMAYVEKLRTAIEKQLEAINALPQVILRKAFRGEL